MNGAMALRLIAEIMKWDTTAATEEYRWLRKMSDIKYDGYSDFRAGVRFLETLATWLKQFKPEDRATAYDFVRRRLVYISPAELQCLVESFVPECVTPTLRAKVGSELGVKPYAIWSTPEGAKAFNQTLRRTLFVGMSDGSRIDMLRRANAGRVSTEQVVPMLNVDDGKWKEIGEKLREVPGMPEDAKYDRVYLIDDFTASGTTFVRRDANLNWKGKLAKFNKMVSIARSNLGDAFPIVESYDLHIHHYISSHQAREALCERLDEAKGAWDEKTFGQAFVTEGLLLPPSVKLEQPADAGILDLCERYYDNALFERLREHCEQAGQKTMSLGYANCALPVVLDHNTPNNSIPLLWAETDGKNDVHQMRPLFFRRDRHG